MTIPKSVLEDTLALPAPALARGDEPEGSIAGLPGFDLKFLWPPISLPL
jgi:hypothetical protein